jgi:hypothetical protein
MKKYLILYVTIIGVTVASTAYAFFFPTPSQMAKMGQQLIMPQPQVCPPCDCVNK